MKIILYGNDFLDTILTLGEFPKPNQTNIVSNFKQVKGGIHNLYRAFQKIDKDYEVLLYPLSTSFATILYEKELCQRSSLVYLDKEYQLTKNQFLENANWKHIAYIDHLSNLTEDNIKDMAKSAILSADFCEGKLNAQIESFLQYISYLFISKEDFEKIPDLINKVSKYSTLIVHNKKGSSVLKNKQVIYSMNINEIENINPLGAGDYFASSFINAILKSKPIEIALKEAHTFATQMILGNYNEI